MTDRLQNKPITKKKDESGSTSDHFLVLHNDNINTFDFVIESLIEVCDHTSEQAEQSAMITHYKGQCDIKKGKKKILSEMQTRLVEKGLKASIE